MICHYQIWSSVEYRRWGSCNFLSRQPDIKKSIADSRAVCTVPLWHRSNWLICWGDCCLHLCRYCCCWASAAFFHHNLELIHEFGYFVSLHSLEVWFIGVDQVERSYTGWAVPNKCAWWLVSLLSTNSKANVQFPVYSTNYWGRDSWPVWSQSHLLDLERQTFLFSLSPMIHRCI